VTATPTSTSTPAGSAALGGRRVAILAGGAVLLLALLVAWWTHARPAPETGFVTETIDRGPIEVAVTATGTVNPVTTVQVGTYVSGPILSIFVDYNSPVTKGQLVAKIDPRPFQVKVQQAEAGVATAQASAAKARADLGIKQLAFQRNGILRQRNLIAQNDLDTARSDYEQAQATVALADAGVKQAQAALEASRIDLGYTDITSPVDGVVVSRNVDVGQTVAASFQTPTLFLIAQDLTKMQVDSSVSESDIGGVAQGQPAWFSVDAYPGRRFQGTVAQVRNAPVTLQNVVTYDVVVAVANADLALKPGMTATVSITTARRDDALRAPIRALRFRPDDAPAESKAEAKEPAVWRLGANGAPERVVLKTGIRNEKYAEVTGGDLAAGQTVVVGKKRAASAEGDQPTAQSPFMPRPPRR
jgi:HlyD family secretion protein